MYNTITENPVCSIHRNSQFCSSVISEERNGISVPSVSSPADG